MKSLLILFTVALFSNGAIATIAETCNLDNAFVDVERNFQTMQQLVCPLTEVHEGQEFQNLGYEILKVAKKIDQNIESKSLSSVEAEDLAWDLDDRLYEFKDALNGLIPQNERTSSDSPIAIKIQNMFDNYSDESSRVEQKEKYLNEIFEIINLTESGEGLVDCFLNNKNPKITNKTIEFETEYNGYDAAFRVDPSNDEGTEFTSILTFNPSVAEPALAVQTVAHELQHACAGDTHVKQHETYGINFDRQVELSSKMQDISEAIDEATLGTWNENQSGRLSRNNEVHNLKEEIIEGAAPPTEEQLQYFRDIYGADYVAYLIQSRDLRIQEEEQEKANSRENSIDELRGFHKQTEVYEEIAQYLPQRFCSPRMIDNFYRNVITTGQVHSNIRTEIDAGTFVEKLLEGYLAFEETGYTRDSFYRINKNGEEVFIPEFQQQVVEFTKSLNTAN